MSLVHGGGDMSAHKQIKKKPALPNEHSFASVCASYVHCTAVACSAEQTDALAESEVSEKVGSQKSHTVQERM